ncbi:MAG: four helix bundle protein [Patescibacteria group bacterium]|nr:four helix bundle protein [Patescibacteria group bacterium]
MTIIKLEELNVWQDSRKLMKIIYETVKIFPPEEKYNLIKHLKESSRNIPGNIAEGFGRFHYQESIQFYRIARGSLNEVKSDIYCASDAGYLKTDKKNEILQQIETVAKMLNGLISSTKRLKVSSPNS